MEIIDCEQRGPDWYRARAGIPTASMFKTVMASGKTAADDSKTRKAYLYKLAGEVITGEPMESFSNHHMERGRVMEEEARAMYVFTTDNECKQVGFIRNGDKGASPDSLIGQSGLLEVKTCLPHIMIEFLIKDQFPPCFKAQTQGQLWVAEREWVDLCVFWPNMPLFVKRAYRDEAYISKLDLEVRLFNAELADVVSRIKSYGVREAA
jgi:hypothetical protein